MWTFILFFLRKQLARSSKVSLAQEMDQKVRRRQVMRNLRYLFACFLNQALHVCESVTSAATTDVKDVT